MGVVQRSASLDIVDLVSARRIISRVVCDRVFEVANCRASAPRMR